MSTESRSTVVAVFPDRESAHATIRALHRAGFHRTWLGVTQSGTVGEGRERVHAEPHGLAYWFHRERDQTLYDALLEHGVEEADARAIDGSVLEGSAVVTVANVGNPRIVERIVRASGGTVTGSIFEHDEVPSPEPESSTNAMYPLPPEDVFVGRFHRHVLGPGPY